MHKYKQKIKDHLINLKNWSLCHRKQCLQIVLLFILIVLYASFRIFESSDSALILSNNQGEYNDKRIIQPSYGKLYQKKEQKLEYRINTMENEMGQIKELLNTMNGSLIELKDNSIDKDIENRALPLNENSTSTDMAHEQEQVPTPIQPYFPPKNLDSINRTDEGQDNSYSNKQYMGPTQPRISRHRSRIINFPVESKEEKKEPVITLPSGSYVKGIIMTGVEAPEGKTYPVLIQLDFAYILPNQSKLDLSGCFMVAKASGDLSIERVQMQATKLSCVSTNGEMFEREINGFVADDQDNSFALRGNVNSKQDRVAAMAFLSSIVEGIGKAIQNAQVSHSNNSDMVSQSIVSGDQSKYIAAGGVSGASSMVTQWYLKQAQNLLPTINVGSGREIWVVMADKVQLPQQFFKHVQRSNSHENSYFHLYDSIN